MSVREKINGDFLYYFDQGKVTDAYQVFGAHLVKDENGYICACEFALYAPTAMNQQKFKFELVDENEVSLKVAGLGICTDIDLGIVKYHFELGAGVDNFNWV